MAYDNPERMPRIRYDKYFEDFPMNESIVNSKNMQSLIMLNFVCEDWLNTQKIINELIAPPLPQGEILPDLDEIIPAMASVFDSVMTMICSGDFKFFDMYDEALSTEYYEEVLLQDVDRITCILIGSLAPRLLGYLLYFMRRDYIPQWVKNNIVRPNMYDAVEKGRARILKKTLVDEELEIIKEMHEMLYNIAKHYMLDHKFDNIDREIMQYQEVEVNDKEALAKNYLEGLDFYIPDCIVDALSDEDPYYAISHSEDVKKFIDEYIVTHNEESFKSLCRRYCSLRDVSVTDSKSHKLYLERASYQHIIGAPRVNGFLYKHLKVLENILKRRDTERDMPIIDTHPYLANIKYIMDMNRDLSEVPSMDDTYVIFTNVENDARRVINYTNKDFLSIYEDPYNIAFGQEKGPLIKTFIHKEFNVLNATGLCKSDEFDLHRVGKVFLPQEMKEEEILKHRDEMIERADKIMAGESYIKFISQLSFGNKNFNEFKYLTANDLLEIKPYYYLRADSEFELGCKLLELKKFQEFVKLREGRFKNEVARRKYIDMNYEEAYNTYLKENDNALQTIRGPKKDLDPYGIDKLERIQELEKENAELRGRLGVDKWKSMKLLKIPKITNARL